MDAMFDSEAADPLCSSGALDSFCHFMSRNVFCCMTVICDTAPPSLYGL